MDSTYNRCGLLEEYNDQDIFKEMIQSRDYIQENDKDTV